MSKREFCFWIVPAGETSQVKKIRVSIWKLASCLLVTSVTLAILMFIAADYLRVQGLRTKNYVLWKTTASERDSLLGEQDDLNSKLDSYEAAAKARAVIGSELESKLDELAKFIAEAKAVDVAGGASRNSLAKTVSENKLLAKIDPNKSPGLHEIAKAIGGLEKECPVGGCSIIEQDLLKGGDAESEALAARATYNSKKLLGDEQGQLERLSQSLKILRAIPLLVPVQGDLSSGFGFRWSPFEHGIVKHEGLDFAADEGTAIGAAGDGEVKDVKRNSTYGLMVDIEHTNRISTRYAHLSSALVTIGEKLKRGDLIGQVGSSGRSTGPHLHYEVLIDGKQVDPKTYLALSDKLSKLMSN